MEKNNNNKIIEIGKKESCSKEQLLEFLPHYPGLSGDEQIFKIIHLNAHQYDDKEMEYLIKGFHFLELKYRNLTSNDFGFGSPTPTDRLLRNLKRINEPLALDLRTWIANNEGNYYIPQNIS